jgi:D-glycero-alpha-D-manno-heptose 1-phosphate guanylyltransferase
MEAIILAGGMGTRLQQVVSNVPKPMASIAGRPFLEILLINLAKQGFHRVLLSVGYLAETICEYFGDNFAGMEILYEIEDKPLGTGGAIRVALDRFSSDHVFVMNGDTYLELDFSEVEKLWQQIKQPIIIGKEVTDSGRYGQLKIIGSLVESISEKKVTGYGLINAGCYVLPGDILNGFQKGISFSFETDFLTDALFERNPFRLFIASGRFIDIGIPEDYYRAQQELITVG